MKEFDFCVEVCLGLHCCGCGEYAMAEGKVILEDGQIDRLVALIREHGGETDVEELSLAVRCPDIYEVLDCACSEAARNATYRYWMIKGFEDGYYEEPDDLMTSLEEAGLFRYEPASGEWECKDDAFHTWLDSYFESLSEEDQVSFIETWYGHMVCMEDPGVYDYAVEIPQGIIDME